MNVMNIYTDHILFLNYIINAKNIDIKHNILNEYNFNNGNGTQTLSNHIKLLYEQIFFENEKNMTKPVTLLHLHSLYDSKYKNKVNEMFQIIQPNNQKIEFDYYDFELFCTSISINDLQRLFTSIYVKYDNYQNTNAYDYS